MATSKDDLTELSDRELLLYVHRDLTRQIAGLAVEVAGVRDAVREIAKDGPRVDALITDVRANTRAVREVTAALQLARARIVDLEAERGKRARNRG